MTPCQSQRLQPCQIIGKINEKLKELWKEKIVTYSKLKTTTKLKDSQDDKCKGHTASTGNMYRGADKSLALPTSRCILFDGENILFDASLFIYT